jgi:phosphoribosyl 1,2-cyclic phosphodiesterase
MTTTGDRIKVLFLGTGAADWPPPYPSPEGSTQPGATRGFTSALIDDRILIDCGPTVPDAMDHFGVDRGRITDILLTHTHDDHWNLDAIRRIADTTQPMNLWAHSSALAAIPTIRGIQPCEARVGDTFTRHGIAITSLTANHDVGDQTALHFLLQKSQTTLLYATDGAWFPRNTWSHLMRTKLDAIIWDATCGQTQGDWRIFEHNSVDMINLMRQTFAKQQVLSPHAQVYLTHLAKSLCVPHDEMTTSLAPQGLIPAYDGMTVSIRRGDR